MADDAMPAPEYTTRLDGAIAIMREIGKIQFEKEALAWFEAAAPKVVEELQKAGVIFPSPDSTRAVGAANPYGISRPMEMALKHCATSACDKSMPCVRCKNLEQEIKDWHVAEIKFMVKELLSAVRDGI